MSGAGVNQCSTYVDCATHTICNAQQQCVSTSGVGVDQCQTDSNCVVVTTHNECNLQKQCVSVSGVGTDQCATSVDCQPVLPPQVFHNECNAQNQCVAVNGLGTDTCQTNNDCVAVVDDDGVDGLGNGGDEEGGGGDDGGDNGGGGDQGGGGGVGLVEDIVSGGGETVQQVITESVKIVEVIATAIVDKIPEPVKAVAVQTKEIIETPQGSAVTKAVSTTGVVIAATVATAPFFTFSFFEIFLIPFRLFGLLLTGMGIKKRISRWGVVYDSVTKQPLDPAYVILRNVNNGKEFSAITDLDGRYGFLVGPGTYQLSAKKTNYKFPSDKLYGQNQDELHSNLYFGEKITIKNSSDVILKNIPLDPLKFDWNEFAKKNKKLMKFYSRWGVVFAKISDVFFVLGFFVAILAYVFAPYPYNTIIMVSYLVLSLLRIFGLKPKPYGRITDSATGNPLSFAIVHVVVPDSGVQIASKPADKYGRYYCLVSPGKYYVKIEKKNEDGSYSLAYTSGIVNVSRKGIIKDRFRI